VPQPSRETTWRRPSRKLHSRLSELTWQARDRRGDYSQRIDFMVSLPSLQLHGSAPRGARADLKTGDRRAGGAAEEVLQHERDLLVAGPLVTFRWQAGDEGVVEYVFAQTSPPFGYDAESSSRPAHLLQHHPLGTRADRRGRRQQAAAGHRMVDAGVRINRRRRRDALDRDYTHLVLDTAGELYGYEGTSFDITGRRQPRRRCGRREEQLRMLSLADDLDRAVQTGAACSPRRTRHAQRPAYKTGLNVLSSTWMASRTSTTASATARVTGSARHSPRASRHDPRVRRGGARPGRRVRGAGPGRAAGGEGARQRIGATHRRPRMPKAIDATSSREHGGVAPRRRGVGTPRRPAGAHRTRRPALYAAKHAKRDAAVG